MKKCPFCGRIPLVLFEEEYGLGGPVIVEYYVDCMCGLVFHGLTSNEEELIEKWNNRINCEEE
jgi:hypothetical protein